MSQFYTEMQGVADDLITRFGRDITLIKEDRTASNTAQPWRGNADSNDVSVVVKGAITSFEDNQVDGDVIRRSDLACFVGNVVGQDVSTFDFVLDEGKRYKIIDVVTYRPGPLTVAYRLQLRT